MLCRLPLQCLERLREKLSVKIELVTVATPKDSESAALAYQKKGRPRKHPKVEDGASGRSYSDTKKMRFSDVDDGIKCLSLQVLEENRWKLKTGFKLFQLAGPDADVVYAVPKTVLASLVRSRPGWRRILWRKWVVRG